MKEARWIILLLLVAAVWGSTFVLVKDTLASFGTFALLAMRFGIAAIVLGAYVFAAGRKITRKEMKYGAILGVFLFIGFGAQTLGLNYISATDSAFVTNLFVLMVPLLSALLLQKMPQRKIWVAIAIAIIGLFLLMGANAADFNIGDTITLICALGYALQVIYLAKYTKECSPLHLAFMQIVIVMLISALLVIPLDQVPVAYPLPALAALVFLALFATIFAQAGQAEVQKRLDPSKVALLLMTEPVFAAVFSALTLGEAFTAQRIAGAILILLSLVIAEYNKIRI